jgi:hypothetical protein
MKRILFILVFFAINYGQTLELYTDANPKLVLRPGWGGYGTLTESTTGGFEGSRCFKFDYTTVNWWSGIFLIPSSGLLDLRSYTNLTIACKVSNPGYLREIDITPMWSTTGTIAPRTYTIFPWNSWESFVIPLDTWSKDSVMNNITGFQIDLIGRDATGTAWFDDIKATGPITPPPPPSTGAPRLITGLDGATRWGDYSYANGWGWWVLGASSQNLTAFCDTNQSWRVDWNFPADTLVQSYPYCAMSSLTQPNMVYQLSSRRATFVTWNIDSVSSTGSGIDAAFDIITCARPYDNWEADTWETELMIWYTVQGDNPLPYLYKNFQPAAKGLMLAGQAWDVYYGIYGADATYPGWHYIAFVRSPDNITNIGRYDINPFFDYAASIGYAKPTDYVNYIAAGVQIWGGTGMMRVGKFKVDWDGSITPASAFNSKIAAERRMIAQPRAIVLCEEMRQSGSNVLKNNHANLFDIKGRTVSSIDAGKMKSGILLRR